MFFSLNKILPIKLFSTLILTVSFTFPLSAEWLMYKQDCGRYFIYSDSIPSIGFWQDSIGNAPLYLANSMERTVWTNAADDVSITCRKLGIHEKKEIIDEWNEWKTNYKDSSHVLTAFDPQKLLMSYGSYSIPDSFMVPLEKAIDAFYETNGNSVFIEWLSEGDSIVKLGKVHVYKNINKKHYKIEYKIPSELKNVSDDSLFSYVSAHDFSYAISAENDSCTVVIENDAGATGPSFLKERKKLLEHLTYLYNPVELLHGNFPWLYQTMTSSDIKLKGTGKIFSCTNKNQNDSTHEEVTLKNGLISGYYERQKMGPVNNYHITTTSSIIKSNNDWIVKRECTKVTEGKSSYDSFKKEFHKVGVPLAKKIQEFALAQYGKNSK